MNDLYKNGYAVIRNAISKKLVSFIALQTNMQKDCENYERGIPLNSYVMYDPNNPLKTDGDYQVSNAYCYRTFCTESLLMTMLPFMEAQTNKKLYPTYSYGRIYFKDAVLNVHKDRPSCQYSATVALQTNNQPWEIYFQGLDGKVNSVLLNDGDVCVYLGTEVYHWREKFNGNNYMQLFLHYVDKNGPHAEWAYDKRAMLGAQYRMDNLSNSNVDVQENTSQKEEKLDW